MRQCRVDSCENFVCGCGCGAGVFLRSERIETLNRLNDWKGWTDRFCLLLFLSEIMLESCVWKRKSEMELVYLSLVQIFCMNYESIWWMLQILCAWSANGGLIIIKASSWLRWVFKCIFTQWNPIFVNSMWENKTISIGFGIHVVKPLLFLHCMFVFSFLPPKFFLIGEKVHHSPFMILLIT